MADFERTRAVLADGRARHLDVGHQISVFVAGELVFESAAGLAGPVHRMGGNTLVSWRCATKAVEGLAIGMLVDRGLVRFDDSLASYFPGRLLPRPSRSVSLRQLLSQAVRFKDDPPAAAIGMVTGHERTAMALSHSHLMTERAARMFAPLGAWTSVALLAGVVERVTGRMYSEFVRGEIFEPLELSNCWIGMPRSVYRQYGLRIGRTWGSSSWDPVQALLESERMCERGDPAWDGRGPVRELAMLFRSITDATRATCGVLSYSTANEMVRPVARGAYGSGEFGLGLCCDGRLFGNDGTSRVVGHTGDSVFAFADLDRHIAAAVMCNGLPGWTTTSARNVALGRAIYADIHRAG